MSDSGHELRENNEKIVKLMSLLKKQRDEMNYLIEKQQLEKGRIETEIEKLTFKLSLLTKSLNQRLQARANYDRTIKEIEENYSNLVEESGKLLFTINKEVHQLEQIMDKKIGTGNEHATGDDKRSSVEQTDGTLSDEEDEQPAKHESEELHDHGQHPFKDLDVGKVPEQKPPQPPEEKKVDMAPITLPINPFQQLSRHPSDDVELQSFREAYGRQHTSHSPQLSVNDYHIPTRRGSTGRRTSRRRSGQE
ncbi:putative autophagy-related protein 11 [Tenebrio molitor]|uniref:putative autophagy-related protein 11 n=1 Tax=Tenebrio molitor TaxID=7067 RepID=UPI00362496FA